MKFTCPRSFAVNTTRKTSNYAGSQRIESVWNGTHFIQQAGRVDVARRCRCVLAGEGDVESQIVARVEVRRHQVRSYSTSM